jgi:hypothetical protein
MSSGAKGKEAELRDYYEWYVQDAKSKGEVPLTYEQIKEEIQVNYMESMQ